MNPKTSLILAVVCNIAGAFFCDTDTFAAMYIVDTALPNHQGALRNIVEGASFSLVRWLTAAAVQPDSAQLPKKPFLGRFRATVQNRRYASV